MASHWVVMSDEMKSCPVCGKAFLLNTETCPLGCTDSACDLDGLLEVEVEPVLRRKSSIINKWYFWVIIVIIALVMFVQKARWDAEADYQKVWNIFLN